MEQFLQYAMTLGMIVVYILLIVVPLLIAVAYLTYAERKVMAAMQMRQGKPGWPVWVITTYCGWCKTFIKRDDYTYKCESYIICLSADADFFLEFNCMGRDTI